MPARPGAHLEEAVIADDSVLMLGVDLMNYPKFPKLDDSVTYLKKDLDIRYELDRYTDFSKEALVTRVIPWSEAYLQLCVDGWAAEIATRYRR